MGYIQGYDIKIYRLREAKDNAEFLIHNLKNNSFNCYSQIRAFKVLVKETSLKGVDLIKSIMDIEDIKDRPDAIQKAKRVFEDECVLIDNIGFKPTNEKIYYENEKQYFNTYNQPKTMNNENYTKNVSFDELKNKAKYTYKLLSNLHNFDDNAIKDTLLKIADKLRYPNEKSQDCIIFHPAEAGGKGIFFKFILQPIFQQYSKKILMSKLTSDFNPFLKDPLVLVLEEGKANKKLIEVLKEIITEDEILINEKGKDQIISKIRFLTFVFSNNTNPINLGRRRGSYHTCKSLGENDKQCCKKGLELVKNIPKEIDILLNYLHNLEFKHQDSILPFKTKIKQQVLDQNKTGIELFFDSIVEFESLEKSFESIFGTNFNFNNFVYISKDQTFITKDIFKEAYNSFCFNKGLDNNIVRHNKDIAQLWSMFDLLDLDINRFIVKNGKDKGRKLDYVNLVKINKKIKEVYKNE